MGHAADEELARGKSPPLWRSTVIYLAGLIGMLAFWVGPREVILTTSTAVPLALLTELFSLLMPVALGRWFGARLDAPRDAQPGPLSRLMSWKAAWLLKLLRPRRGAPRGALADGRPTALLLGDQAEALFRSLPATDRSRLEGVEAAINRLRDGAIRLQQREALLGKTLAEVGGDGDAKRDAVRRELAAEQQSARLALGETIATLDALRLDLLRLRAGTATVDGMTDALETVRRVGAEVDARLAALKELDQF